MMSILFYILGFSLTSFVIIDLIWTTFWVDGGAGPLSDTLTTSVWQLIKKIDNKLFYNLTGPITLALTLLSWFLFLWIGVALFFAGDPGSIVNTTTNQTATWTDLIYYSGFTLFTLGIGDFTPQSAFFKIVTALVSGMGMMLLTFGASYIISVVSAVVEKRSFARSVSGLGATSTELLKNIWDGKDFHQFDLILSSLNDQITKLTQQNQAFPLVQYYHSENPRKASAVNTAILDEALTILRYGVADKSTVNLTLVKATQSSIQTYSETAIQGYGNQVDSIEEIPPEIDLSSFKEIPIEMKDPKEFTTDINELSDRRNNLFTIIKIDNHEWPNT